MKQKMFIFAALILWKEDLIFKILYTIHYSEIITVLPIMSSHADFIAAASKLPPRYDCVSEGCVMACRGRHDE